MAKPSRNDGEEFRLHARRALPEEPPTDDDLRLFEVVEQEVNAERQAKGLPPAGVNDYVPWSFEPGSPKRLVVPVLDPWGEVARFQAFGPAGKSRFEYLARVPEEDLDWAMRGNQLESAYFYQRGRRTAMYRYEVTLKEAQVGVVGRIASQAGAPRELPPAVLERMRQEDPSGFARYGREESPPRKLQYYRPGGFDVASTGEPELVGFVEPDGSITLIR
jgi:hypothetical protein